MMKFGTTILLSFLSALSVQCISPSRFQTSQTFYGDFLIRRRYHILASTKAGFGFGSKKGRGIAKSKTESESMDKHAEKDIKNLKKLMTLMEEHPEATYRMVELGEDVNLIDKEGNSPLHIACVGGYADLVTTFVNGVNFNKSAEQISSGVDIVKRPFINQQNAKGLSPLMIAAREDNKEIVEILLRVGADVNVVDESGNSALHLTSQNGFSDLVAKLVQSGCNINLQNSNHITPLAAAIVAGHEEVVEKMIELGANLNIDVSEDSRTALHLAIMYNLPNVVTNLVQSGSDINAQTSNHVTPLMLAVLEKNEKILERLIELGADKDIPDSSGSSVLHLASKLGLSSMVTKLVRIGLDINAQSLNGTTPLMEAVTAGHLKLVESLIALGANVNSVDDEGDSALHHASMRGFHNIVMKLVNSGADINRQNIKGLSPVALSVSLLTHDGPSITSKSHPSKSKRMPTDSSISLHNQIVLDLIKNGATLSKLDIKTLFNPADKKGNERKKTIIAALEESTKLRHKAKGGDYLDWIKSYDRSGDWDEFISKEWEYNPGQRDIASSNSIPTVQERSFMELYGFVVSLLNQPLEPAPSWAQLRLQLGLGLSIEAEAEANEEKEDAMIQRAMVAQLATSASSLTTDDGEIDDILQSDVSDFEDQLLSRVDDYSTVSAKLVQKIEFSQQVVKWWNAADDKYKLKFSSVMNRIAQGRRSYALSKRLQNSIWPIYESKLYGHRILWTPVNRESESHILVWCVSCHDYVPRRMKQIDRSYSNLASHHVTTVDAMDVLQLADEDELLNPFRNTPMKLFVTSREEVASLSAGSEWRPPLLLSRKQKEINSQLGTVLLLGRSGTGKTKYLADRMVSDACASAPRGEQFGQLFVSRTVGVCELVKFLYKDGEGSSRSNRVDFFTLERFITQMEDTVRLKRMPSSRTFPKKQRVDFSYFRDQLFPQIKSKDNTMDPLVVWTQIRSFIKGSIEAVLLGRPLHLKEYLDLEAFGKERCRLPKDLRRKAYEIYSKYEAEMRRRQMWDDADRVMDILARCNLTQLKPLSGCISDEFGDRDYDKVYVDEIQDCTQAETSLFFLAAGLQVQSLFLAGDPAQAVVEGVDFRFEEVRSIVYKLSQGKETLERPMKLFVNYRSHTGILRCASAVIEKLCSAYPGSARVLPPDLGYSQGPRPAYYMTNGTNSVELRTILTNNERLVVLCLDENNRRAALSESDGMVLGIREAKGLEFTDVVVLDFFSGIPSSDQRVWKTLLTADDQQIIQSSWSPQVETQLKLLYTAITRSCNRLIFVETHNSVAGSAFFSWLQANELAEPLIFEEDNAEEVSGQIMTGDEWRARGIDCAVSAEGPSAISLLQSAVQCFKKAKDSKLFLRASVELKLKEMIQRWKSRNVDKRLNLSEEKEAVELMEKLLTQQLFLEAIQLCDSMGPISSFPNEFNDCIASQLQTLKNIYSEKLTM